MSFNQIFFESTNRLIVAALIVTPVSYHQVLATAAPFESGLQCFWRPRRSLLCPREKGHAMTAGPVHRPA